MKSTTNSISRKLTNRPLSQSVTQPSLLTILKVPQRRRRSKSEWNLPLIVEVLSGRTQKQNRLMIHRLLLGTTPSSSSARPLPSPFQPARSSCSTILPIDIFSYVGCLQKWPLLSPQIRPINFYHPFSNLLSRIDYPAKWYIGTSVALNLISAALESEEEDSVREQIKVQRTTNDLMLPFLRRESSKSHHIRAGEYAL